MMYMNHEHREVAGLFSPGLVIIYLSIEHHMLGVCWGGARQLSQLEGKLLCASTQLIYTAVES